MSIDLSKLIALEAALEHLLKANPQEELEYIDDESQLPDDTRLVRTNRGALAYYPSEIGQHHPDKMEEDIKGTRAEQGVAVDRPELEPDEEREISAVTADSPVLDDLLTEDDDTFYPERSAMVTADQANDYFEQVSLYLDFYLQQAKGSDFKPFLGKDIDPARLSVDNATKAGYTDGSKEGSGEPTGLGINSLSNWTVTIEGKPFVYKLVKGENQGEILSYSIDRALGLNIVPYNKQHSIDIDVLKSLIERTQNVDDAIEEFYMDEHAREGRGAKAGGHFQEFCTNCLGREASVEAMATMMASEEGREEFFKVILLDFLVGNDDRHTGNYLITDEHKIVAIDNGFAGHNMSFANHHEKKSADLLGTSDLTGETVNSSLENMGFPFWMAGTLREQVGNTRVSEISDIKALEREAGNVFDKYFTPDNKKILNKALQMSMWELKVGKGTESDFAKVKDNFVAHAAQNLQIGIVGQGTGLSFPDETAPEVSFFAELDDLVSESQIAAAVQNAVEEAGLENAEVVDNMLSDMT